VVPGDLCREAAARGIDPEALLRASIDGRAAGLSPRGFSAD
jgi:hypothetical protein